MLYQCNVELMWKEPIPQQPEVLWEGSTVLNAQLKLMKYYFPSYALYLMWSLPFRF
jgi:hypothetical protein